MLYSFVYPFVYVKQTNVVIDSKQLYDI